MNWGTVFVFWSTMKVFSYILARYTSLIRYKICRCFLAAGYLLLALTPTPGPHHEMLSRVCLGLTRAPVSALQVSGTASTPLRHGTKPRTAPLFFLLPLLSLPPFAFLRQSSCSPGWPQPFNMLVLQRCATVCLSSAFCFGVWNGHQW